MLGYRGNSDWRDMSEYVVHFTKASGGQDAYQTMLSILSQNYLRPGGPFGTAKGLGALGDSQKSACFSEIPLDHLSRLIERRSYYGIAFKQPTLTKAGGGRVWYVDEGSPLAKAVWANHERHHKSPFDPTDPFWKLTPFIDRPSEERRYQFEWEREWRVPGGLTFQPDDVAFLFLPEDLHLRARTFFEEAQRENFGPAYLCPYLDPTWTEERLQQAAKEFL
jgi:hypothetical protein